MKTGKLKLTEPKCLKSYKQGRSYLGFETTTNSTNTTDPTTTCTTVGTTTHIVIV